MTIVTWPKCRHPIRTEYRLIIPISMFHHILFIDRKKDDFTLKEKLSFLCGITKIKYEYANHPSILLWIEKYRDNESGWKEIELTINTHIGVL